MWRKGGRLAVKLICLWFFFGAYSFWKHLHGIGLPGEVDVHAFANKGKDGRLCLEEDERKYPLSPSSQGGKDQEWHSDATAVSSRHLLSVLSNCTPRAVDQFPKDGLTEAQRRQGYIVLHMLLAAYMFLALAILCDRYFVPSLEVLCEFLNLETDVAGATFMAAGSSAPELATAVIGVFVAKADVGLSTVVGSAIYNIMFVISMAALFATSAIQLQRWPLIRDCIAYLISVITLVLVIADTVVDWYESVTLIVLYALYVGFMLVNKRMESWCVPRVERLICCLRTHTPPQQDRPTDYDTFPEPSVPDGKAIDMKEKEENSTVGETTHLTQIPDHAHQEAETWHRLCERPEGAIWTAVWVVAMPLSVLLFFTVPDCRRPALRKLFWLSFIMSLFWLSIFCFLMVWMITVIGYTLGVPDSMMSLTFIAFGVSLPDVVSSVLVVRDGLGDMAVSNAIGSNVFDILVCLGLPWFLATCVMEPGSSVPVYSEGLLYSSVMLLSTVAFLLLVTHLNGWQLTKKYGILLLVVYIIYTTMAALYELNVFGYFHPPECPSSY